ncbi:MAG: helix-turn-helix domain-containing protein [Chloroflexi bacterium]|nr:helix-turn-helix domain-containing protein [Chloroflexota bacterium]
MQEARFENSDVVRVTGRATATIQTWVNRGVLVPASGQNPGYAQRRRYSAADVCQIAVLGALSDFGLPPGEARDVASYVGRKLADEGAAVAGDALLRICRSKPSSLPPLVRAAERIAACASTGSGEAHAGDYHYEIFRGRATVAVGESVSLFLPLGTIVAEVMRGLGLN